LKKLLTEIFIGDNIVHCHQYAILA